MEAIDDLVRRLEQQFPDGIAGLVHFASSPLDSAGMAENTEEAMHIIDVHFKALVHLVGRLTPLMQRHGKPCRIMTVSSGAALGAPSSWSLPSGQRIGMYSLVKSFVEQYTEALAFELRHTRITVCCARVEGTFRTELHDLTRSAMAQPISELMPGLTAVWELPAAEAHGRVIPARPKQQLRAGQISGGSVVGASTDCRFALRAAVSAISDYPANGWPDAYKTLAGALGFPTTSLCWFHGSSDALMRCTTTRLGCAAALGPGAQRRAGAPEGALAAIQVPTWHHADQLLRKAGAHAVAKVPYGNPWLEEDGDAAFWEALEAQLQGSSPPALVYLVHPHFPTGFNARDFHARLAHALQVGGKDALFMVDQCYLGFTDSSAADENRALEELAMSSDRVVLVRSLSKVEGLAGVRLGYTVASAATTRQLAAGLPFAGGLYISEIDLAAAVAALLSPDTAERKAAVVDFYREERDWLSDALQELGLEVTSSVAPYACLRGPEQVLRDAAKEGAQVMVYDCPTSARLNADVPFGSAKLSAAVFLVADRAANEYTVSVLRRKMKEYDGGGFKLPWISL